MTWPWSPDTREGLSFGNFVDIGNWWKLRTGRVLLALQDGDVLVYATTRGKSKAAICNWLQSPILEWILMVHDGSHTHTHFHLLAHSGKSVVTCYRSKTSFKTGGKFFFQTFFSFVFFFKPVVFFRCFLFFSNQACDLALKFPHVSVLPFKLHSFRGWPRVSAIRHVLVCWPVRPNKPTARFPIDMMIYWWHMMIWYVLFVVIWWSNHVASVI